MSKKDPEAELGNTGDRVDVVEKESVICCCSRWNSPLPQGWRRLQGCLWALDLRSAGSGTALVAPISQARGFPLHRLQSKTNET